MSVKKTIKMPRSRDFETEGGNEATSRPLRFHVFPSRPLPRDLVTPASRRCPHSFPGRAGVRTRCQSSRFQALGRAIGSAFNSWKSLARFCAMTTAFSLNASEALADESPAALALRDLERKSISELEAEVRRLKGLLKDAVSEMPSDGALAPVEQGAKYRLIREIVETHFDVWALRLESAGTVLQPFYGTNGFAADPSVILDSKKLALTTNDGEVVACYSADMSLPSVDHVDSTSAHLGDSCWLYYQVIHRAGREARWGTSNITWRLGGALPEGTRFMVRKLPDRVLTPDQSNSNTAHQVGPVR